MRFAGQEVTGRDIIYWIFMFLRTVKFLKINVCDLNFDNLTMGEAVNKGMELMERKNAAYVVTPNSEIAWMCRKDEEFKNIIENIQKNEEYAP